MHMSLNNRLLISIFGILLVTGCASNKEMYYWGEYEQLIHDAYVNPGMAASQTQIEKINTVLQKSESLGKKTAPGIYAHLGFLYAVQGKSTKSKEAFMGEKSLYPESNVFIDGMMNRAMKNEKNH